LIESRQIVIAMKTVCSFFGLFGTRYHWPCAACWVEVVVKVIGERLETGIIAEHYLSANSITSICCGFNIVV